MTDTSAVTATAATYDRIAADYQRRNADPPAQLTEFRSEFVAAVAAVGAGGVVADLGCGPGRDAVHFAAAGLSVVGVDASRQMAALAHQAGVRVVVADIRYVPLVSGCLDGIWSSASLLHIPREDVPSTLTGWAGCLRPGGVLGLSTSLGSGEGWDDEWPPRLEPAGVRSGDDGLRRWFVDHHREPLLCALAEVGFHITTVETSVSHRTWLKVLARKTANRLGVTSRAPKPDCRLSEGPPTRPNADHDHPFS